MKNNQRGITLIALVITIIVLLILAGVSIAMLTGDNGIVTQAQKAKEKTEEAKEIEKIGLAISEIRIGKNGYQELDAKNFKEALDSQFQGRDILLMDNEDGTFTVTLDDKIYNIGNNEVNEVQVDLYINNAEDLKKFRDEVNNGNMYEGKYIVLTSDITLDINEEWIPIGTYLNENTSVTDKTNIPFKGIFDGQNNTVDGLKITSKEKGKGLFGLVSNGTIKNVVIGENCNIDAGVSFGSITGYLINNGNVINCVNEANLKANGTNMGGIVGTNVEKSTIKRCVNRGIIQGEKVTGGIVGSNAGNILYCYNSNTVNSKNSLGGICGVNTGIIKESYNISNIESETSNVGGIVGALQQNGNIENSYNVGNIIGTGTNVGGIIGLGTENSKLSNSYSIGYVTTSKSNNGGGIVGYNQSTTVSNCYYLINSVNGGNGIVLDGTEFKSKEEMKNSSQILGKAFKKDSSNINGGYPILSWQ